MAIHDTIRQLREQKHWSQERMAEQLKMSTNGYAKIERGESTLNLERLEQVADAFDINVVDLLAMEHQRNVVFMVKENGDYATANYYGTDEATTIENEKLKMMVSHKDEIIKQKDNEIETLKMLVETLQKLS